MFLKYKMSTPQVYVSQASGARHTSYTSLPPTPTYSKPLSLSPPAFNSLLTGLLTSPFASLQSLQHRIQGS